MKIGKVISAGTITSIDILSEVINEHGPIPTCRVSSAQASCPYSYWDAVRYEVRLRKDGTPTNVALERASSATRSVAKAERMLAKLEEDGRIQLQKIGELSDADADMILRRLRADSEVACG